MEQKGGADSKALSFRLRLHEMFLFIFTTLKSSKFLFYHENQLTPFQEERSLGFYMIMI